VDKQLSASIITRVHSNPGLLQSYDKNCITPDSIFETPNEINCIWTDSIYPTLTKQIKKPTTPVREIVSPLIQFLQPRMEQIESEVDTISLTPADKNCISPGFNFYHWRWEKLDPGLIQFLQLRMKQIESGLIQFIAFTVVKIVSGVIQFIPPRLNKLEIWQLR